ncbi:cytochrome P450 [Teratosphaeria nubilosa]|uniref:Cytochrome P450 n=1 Tax=Teratosphaeria nubilosa TaxID=161662 RepID=A0A6G1KVQ8_9PEZI|nr:cytochrome P450 [Teratosphaeria nubilosa]
MFTFIASHPIAVAIATITLVYLLNILAKGYRIRKLLHTLPGPPGHSMLFGHLQHMGKIMSEIPPQAHPHVTPHFFKRKYGLQRNWFYVDIWPFGDPMLHVFDPKVVQQVTVEHVTPKGPGLALFMGMMAGEGDLISSEGAVWKRWRTIFNPGFAAGHLMTLVPGIVDDTVVFCEKLSEHAADGKVFRLEEDAMRLTVDVIGKVSLDLRLNSQRGEHELITAFRDQVQRLPTQESTYKPWNMWHPVDLYKRWRNGRIMDAYIAKVLDERFSRAREAQEEGGDGGGKRQRKRAVIDLALDAYQQENDTKAVDGDLVMDAGFKQGAITQIRAFIFAGHDTTSSTICYMFYELQRNPGPLARLRQEHDEILGPVGQTAEVIKNDPYIINRLEYTLAVVKETLRLWPPGSSVRKGEPGFFIRDPETGERYPTEGMFVWVTHWPMHHDPLLWGPDAGSFKPERFIPSDPEYLVPENGFRPFEQGPRNCIGQELAMIEARIVLALAARSFEVQPAYGRLAELSRVFRKSRMSDGQGDFGGKHTDSWTGNGFRTGTPVERRDELGAGAWPGNQGEGVASVVQVATKRGKLFTGVANPMRLCSSRTRVRSCCSRKGRAINADFCEVP